MGVSNFNNPKIVVDCDQEVHTLHGFATPGCGRHRLRASAGAESCSNTEAGSGWRHPGLSPVASILHTLAPRTLWLRASTSRPEFARPGVAAPRGGIPRPTQSGGRTSPPLAANGAVWHIVLHDPVFEPRLAPILDAALTLSAAAQQAAWTHGRHSRDRLLQCYLPLCPLWREQC
ncbi:MAG: hypothetical protein WDW36_006541 [Sanguina aurantia]